MNNNYGFGEDQLKSTNTPFPIAVDVDNVEISDCKYVAAEDGSWEAIEMTYKRGAAVLNDRMFAINKDNVSARPWITGDTPEDAYANAVKTLNTQLYHIANKLGITREELSGCNGKTFKTLANDYAKLIKSNCEGVKLYLKVTRTDKGFPKVGRTTSSTQPFLQEMNGPCTLEYSKKEALAALMNTAPQNGVVGATKNETTSVQWTPDSV